MPPAMLTRAALAVTVPRVPRSEIHFMFSTAALWIPFTILAAIGQVARNAMQRSLTGPLGTWGATNIRFLFGFPFSIVFFGVVIVATGDRVPWPTPAFWPWLLLGALSQILATGLMLAAMNDRSFVVTTAYLKTEAIQTAIFGFIFLGDHLTALKVVAILIATVGVVVTALRPGAVRDIGSWRPTVLGFGRGRGVCVLGSRLSRCHPRGARRVVRDGGVLYAGVGPVRADLGADDLSGHACAKSAAGYLAAVEAVAAGRLHGAAASQFWFLAFALTAAANVRTLALVEVLFAQAVAYYSFKQPLSARELSGIALIVVGVALLVAV